jgi:DHA2 family methylenomycin A resistance protein-like MFS transporter
MGPEEGNQPPSVTAKGIVAVACVVTGASMTLSATTDYILQPMADDFGLDGAQASILRLAPTLATILIVFVAGVLGDRLGHRRAISWATGVFLIGCLMTAAAPAVFVLIAGLCVTAASASVMTIVALALLSASVSGNAARARAFGTLGVVGPVVYVVVPVAAGVMVTWLEWRLIIILWALLGVAALWMTRRMLASEATDRTTGELLTPILGGIVLVLGTQALNRLGENGPFASITLVVTAATAVTALILWAVHRRMPDPTLSYEPIRHIRSLLLLMVCVLIPLTSMWFTTYLVFQYLFGLNPVEISLILIPAQAAGIVGAKTMPKLIIARGLRTAALVGFGALTVAELSFLIAGTDSLALVGVLMTLYGLVTGALSVAIANVVMNAAPADGGGAMASYRAAASRIGGALASVLIASLALGTYHASLGDRAVDAGLDPQEAGVTAAYLADQLAGADESATFIPPPAEELTEVSRIQQWAILDALRTKSLAGAAIAASGGLMLAWAMRSRREDQAASPEQPAPSGA